ncbi:MAG: molybdopterin biosynthesis protein [Chloroflexota bacterium]|nr:molybdopterin biosynthesis protein [Chloroflexota bacterium]
MMRRETPYLHDIGLEEAIEHWYAALLQAEALGTLPSETLPVGDCAGRVTAAPVWARISSPHYHASAMDGYAVRAEDTAGATETSPLRLALNQQAFYVDTGDPIPAGTDAVIMIEDTQLLPGEQTADPDISTHIEIMAATPPWRHVRAMGEDIVATQLVLPSNHYLRPQDLGAAVGCGHTHLAVRCQPRVAVIPTGSELVTPGEPGWETSLQPGDIVEYNSLVLGAMAQEWGCQVSRLASVPDEFDRIRSAVEVALSDHDIVVINAGSSAGSEDFTARVVDDLGQVLVHGAAIRPGHPVVLGIAGGKPVIGIPGFPVSAAMTFELFVKPLVYRWQGLMPPERPIVRASLTQKVHSPLGEDEFLRVTVGRVGDRLVATPLKRGAGVIMSLVRADGIVQIPRFSEGEHAGSQVSVELLRSPESIRNTIVSIGSHDLTLDVLADQLRRNRPELTLASSNVGSYGGLLALQRNEAHFAGSHLLDAETGEYNIKFIRELLPTRQMILLRFVGRVQGLIVQPENPKEITSLADLARADVSFVNRQRGAGTRVLLDYQLKQLGIKRRQIQGYERPEFTHLAVAAAVQSGTADCGLGIRAAASALRLGFVPLFNERYDLVIPAEYYDSELLEPLMAVIRSAEFSGTVEALGGYDTAGIGEVIAEL